MWGRWKVRKREHGSSEYVCGRGRKTVGGLEGVESVALPQGSVCKPLSTPQSCFHKEIYKTGLRCALLPCIMSECECVNVCVCVFDLEKWAFLFFYSLTYFLLCIIYAKKIWSNLPIQTGQTLNSPSGAVWITYSPWWQCLCGCVCLWVCVHSRVNVFHRFTHTRDPVSFWNYL